jgi:hypothetical protein
MIAYYCNVIEVLLGLELELESKLVDSLAAGLVQSITVFDCARAAAEYWPIFAVLFVFLLRKAEAIHEELRSAISCFAPSDERLRVSCQ